MDDEALTALKGSIAKWEGITAGTVHNHGADNCPLCRKFLTDLGGNGGCEACPVGIATGETGCDGTPYYQYVGADSESEEKDAAQAMLNFLISLLPPGETP